MLGLVSECILYYCCDPWSETGVRSDNLATTLRLRLERERDWGQQPPTEIVDSARLRPGLAAFPAGAAVGPALTSYVMIM